MVYVVTDSGVITGKDLKEINRTLNADIELDELRCVGVDRIINLTDRDIDFVQDKRKMSKIFFGNFFKSDTKILKITQFLEIAFLAIIMLLVFSCSKNIEALINAISVATGH